MTVFSYSGFINFWRKLYQKFENLSIGKQLGVILITIIVIWQAICFVQGAITARAMNYYCEKEAGIKLAEGTYFMEIPKDEYEKNCWKKQVGSYPFYCEGSYDRKEQWIEVVGSVKRDFSFGIPKRPSKAHPEDFIPPDIGGLRKTITYSFNSNKILTYTEVDFVPNADLILADSLSYYLFKKSQSNFRSNKSCGFSRFPLGSKDLEKYKVYVNER